MSPNLKTEPASWSHYNMVRGMIRFFVSIATICTLLYVFFAWQDGGFTRTAHRTPGHSVK